MKHKNELAPPPDTADDTGARECLRVWVMSEGLQVSVLPHVLSEPAAWGIVLADILHHACGAYEHFKGLDPQETRAAILDMLADELNSPTDEPTGGVE